MTDALAAYMLPTHVGMNLAMPRLCLCGLHAPHTRGDEPFFAAQEHAPGKMLPTHVGMNLHPPKVSTISPDAPHTRGDEPIQETRAIRVRKCSPHTWG